MNDDDVVKKYEDACDRTVSWCGIPERMRGGLARYILHQIPPGHFLTAVLKNDLMEAVSRADDENVNKLPSYVMFLYNFAPSGCYGSPEDVKRWLEKKP